MILYVLRTVLYYCIVLYCKFWHFCVACIEYRLQSKIFYWRRFPLSISRGRESMILFLLNSLRGRFNFIETFSQWRECLFLLKCSMERSILRMLLLLQTSSCSQSEIESLSGSCKEFLSSYRGELTTSKFFSKEVKTSQNYLWCKWVCEEFFTKIQNSSFMISFWFSNRRHVHFQSSTPLKGWGR